MTAFYFLQNLNIFLIEHPIIQGYTGKSCSLHKTNNVANEWHFLASSYSGLSPRAAHTAIYVHETDSLYVYGGYDLNNVLGALQVYSLPNEIVSSHSSIIISTNFLNIFSTDLSFQQ